MGRKKIAYAGPFVVFMLFLLLAGLLSSGAKGAGEAMYWVFPVQTIVCAGMMAFYWKEYRLAWPRQLWLAIGIGVIVLLLWIAPEYIPGLKPRLVGFDPDLFAANPQVYWGVVLIRFARLVLVVPLMEELFWRGFLLRYLIADDFDTVPMGTYSAWGNIVVAVLFMIEHSWPDYPAALAAGFLFNLVAYRSKSLSACVVAHAVTNGLLGLYIMETKHWGFW
jgi:uncharacterized protein